MRQIILDTKLKQINLSDVDPRNPIFAKENGKLRGMVNRDHLGFIVLTSIDRHWNGYHPTLEKLIKSCATLEFFTE